MTDDLEKNLRALTGEIVKGRPGLSETEKDELIRSLGGPLTVGTLCKAKTTLPLERIPFLYSSLDPQNVADVLVNDMKEALKRALSLKLATTRKAPLKKK
ncbi:MAG: hypothetical protein H7249_00165 [Chitinophagaceae bacterium]|nr:hypothetical protein [Oligoflexus sp.]